MHLRAGDREDRCELADSEVRPQARARDHEASLEGKRPGTTASTWSAKAMEYVGQRCRWQAGEQRASAAVHLMSEPRRTIRCGVERAIKADPWSEPGDAVGAST